MTHPYAALPDPSFWRRSVAGVAPGAMDPVVRGKFRIAHGDRIATAGSCFAQHVSRHLAQAGFEPYVTETAHPVVASRAAGWNYGVFTARYGNVYTARQFLQLLQRAYGLFAPLDDVWHAPDGSWIDPFRPAIQPGGFASLSEYRADRQQHFAAVRTMVERMDVLVFTLGLTEAWMARADGAVYPICPGVAGGTFDPEAHRFVNFSAAEVRADMEAAIAFIQARNRRIRVLLTVSPVPLVATMEPQSVLTATTYSKAVLRVAAEEVAAGSGQVAYFPSFEVITGPHARGAYFADDLRSVTEDGVRHVMMLFQRHYMSGTAAAPSVQAAAVPDPGDAIRRAIAVVCDEVLVDPG